MGESAMSTTQAVKVICNRCKENIQINVDREAVKKGRKGGLFSVEVPHGESGGLHTTIFYLSLNVDRIQVRGQVTADSIAESIQSSSEWDINKEHAESMDRLLKNFLGFMSKLDMVFVSDMNGKIKGMTTGTSMEELQIYEIERMVTLINIGVAKSFRTTSIGTSVFEIGKTRFMFVQAGPKAMLTVVTRLDISTENVLAYTYIIAEKMARLLDGESISVDIPLLELQNREGYEKGRKGIRYLTAVPGSYVAKLIMVGHESVGKTSLTHRFVEGKFETDYKPTIGVNFMSKTIKLAGQGTQITYTISDMGGQEQFARVRRSYYRGAHASFIIFDLTSRTSFEAVKNWYQETIDYAGRSTAIIIIGNKADLINQRVIETEEAVELVRNLNCTYVETSAKTGENVVAAFNLIALYLVERAEKYLGETEDSDFIVEEYLKGRALPADMFEQLASMIANFDF